MRDRANITIAFRQEAMYLPSNGAIANVVHRDLDTYFQGHKIWNANIVKTVKASEKRAVVTFMEAGIRHSRSSLRMLYSVTLTYIFKVQRLKR